MIAYRWDGPVRGWTSSVFGFTFAQVVTYLFWRCWVIHELTVLLKTLETGEKISIVGHSMGALILP